LQARAAKVKKHVVDIACPVTAVTDSPALKDALKPPQRFRERPMVLIDSLSQQWANVGQGGSYLLISDHVRLRLKRCQTKKGETLPDQGSHMQGGCREPSRFLEEEKP